MPLSDADLALRQNGIGGSEVAAVLGLSPWRKPIDVYLEKTGQSPAFAGNERTRWGEILEPVVADHYAERHDVELRPFASRRHRDRDWHIYSVDREVWNGDELVRILEIKTRGWRAAEGYGAEETDDVPQTDLCQVAWYLAGREVAEADLAVLFNSHDYREYRVERDAELEGYLIGEVERFWYEHVVAGKPPPPDGSASFKRYLAGKFSKTSGELRRAHGDLHLEQVAEDLRATRALERSIEKYRARLEQDLQAAIADDDGLELDAGRITWRTDRQGRVALSRVLAEVVDRYNVPADELAAIEAEHRAPPQRRFLTPRVWAKDKHSTQQLGDLIHDQQTDQQRQ